MKINKLKKILFCGFISLFTLSSCGDDSSSQNSTVDPNNLPYYLRPLEVIHAATPKTDELTKQYYETVIKNVSKDSVWDRDFQAHAEFVSTSDGDTTTLKIKTTEGIKNISLRYYGVDTPELHSEESGIGSQPWGIAAKQFVEYRFNQAKENNWDIVVEGGINGIETTYNRQVGYIWVGPHLINLELVEIGLGRQLIANADNDRHDEWNLEVEKVRKNTSIYPSTMQGTFGHHVMNYIDPNWEYALDDHTAIETNPAVKDRNYKYNFDFTKSGKMEEIPLCVEKPDLCICI